MTVDEVIAALQQISAEGNGKLPVRSWSGDTIEPVDPPAVVNFVRSSRKRIWHEKMGEEDRGRQFVLI